MLVSQTIPHIHVTRQHNSCCTYVAVCVRTCTGSSIRIRRLCSLTSPSTERGGWGYNIMKFRNTNTRHRRVCTAVQQRYVHTVRRVVQQQHQSYSWAGAALVRSCDTRGSCSHKNHPLSQYRLPGTAVQPNAMRYTRYTTGCAYNTRHTRSKQRKAGPGMTHSAAEHSEPTHLIGDFFLLLSPLLLLLLRLLREARPAREEPTPQPIRRSSSWRTFCPPPPSRYRLPSTPGCSSTNTNTSTSPR